MKHIIKRTFAGVIMKIRKLPVILLPLVLIMSAYIIQDKKQEKVKQKEIDTAIAKGTKYLLERLDAYLNKKDAPVKPGLGQKPGPNPTAPDNIQERDEEIILYTLVHADVNEKNPLFKKLLEKILSKKLATKQTYNLAVEAMALLSYDPLKYQDRMAEIAQVLVDRQCKNGQWTYHGTSNPTKDIETGKDNTTTTHDKNKGLKKISIKRQNWGPQTGDNSNTQYAALGLRACFEANIDIDKDVLKLAKECYEKCQNPDGGWDYQYRDNGDDEGTQLQDPLKKKPNPPPGRSIGSMTVGGLGALASYKQMLKEDYKNDSRIQKAIEWVDKNFAVDKNPAPGGTAGAIWHYYYLYGMERAGALACVDKFGSHDWYQEGASYLLKQQQSNGSWKGGFGSGIVVDTCFAILFLRKATEHLLETGR